MFSLKLAWRYAFSRSNRHRSATLIILSGIAVGMLAIIIMVSLMNSLQSDLLDQVKSIESFHVQVSFISEDPKDVSMDEIAAALQQVPHVHSVYPHVNTQVLLQNPLTDRSTTARLRMIDSHIWESENPFSDRAYLLNGKIPNPTEVVLGSSLARKLGVYSGTPIAMTVLGSGRAVVLAPMVQTVDSVDTFRTGLPEFDESTLITDLYPLIDSIGPKRITYGLYLEDAYTDKAAQVVDTITTLYPHATVRTWQQVNSAFYSALTLEKILMYLFLFFMFIILAVNMKNASSRLLFVKQRELAILRAVGAQQSLATRVLLGQTAIITVLGEVIGITAGVVVGQYIGTLFSWIHTVQYFFTKKSNLLLMYPFSTQVRPFEVLVIAVLVLFLALLFTYVGCRHALRREPMEMLYHD